MSRCRRPGMADAVFGYDGIMLKQVLMLFAGKTVVITGGARGIGAACAEAFRREGARIALLDRFFPEGEGTHGDLRFACDVSDETAVRDAMERIASAAGGIDVLVNSAGIQRYGTVTETSSDTWDEVMRVNVKGSFLCAKYAIPYMRCAGKGVVANVASVQAFLSQQNVAAYTTAKSALLGLTRSIAVDYAPGIRAVTVCPGTIDTPMFRESLAASPDPGAMLQECVEMHPAGRIGKPEEVAAMILYLSGDAAGFVTGQAFRIDGGLGIGIAGTKKEE